MRGVRGGHPSQRDAADRGRTGRQLMKTPFDLFEDDEDKFDVEAIIEHSKRRFGKIILIS